MSENPRAPEAANFLRRLLRGLPHAVREVVMSTHLQRSGCAHCGVGPHSTHDCPLLGKDEAEEKAAALYGRWINLVGEELVIFSRSVTTSAYIEAAQIRFANRSDLPRRPPRRMKHNMGTGQQQQIQEPLLPTPMEIEPPQQLPRQTAKAKPQSAPAVILASVLGNRRYRDFTPGSAEGDRPDKFLRVE